MHARFYAYFIDIATKRYRKERDENEDGAERWWKGVSETEPTSEKAERKKPF